MKRIGYFDCFAGISGDMILGALVDAGLSFRHLKAELEKLDITGWTLKEEKVLRHGLAGTRIHVQVEETHHHRHLPDITRIIEKSRLSPDVKEMTLSVFSLLARAEAAVHGVTTEEVHFHEVGALDAIIDITGAAIGLAALDIDELFVSSLNTGSGHVDTAHGRLPVPAPATARLLENFEMYSSGIETELVTPTGAAIIATLCSGSTKLPPMTLEATGYGAGSKELESPNLLRFFIGSEQQTAFQKESIIQLETNIDDSSPEIIAWLTENLLQSGALDAFITPVMMKKNRSAHLLTVLTTGEKEEALSRIIFRESSSSGIRRSERQRYILPRESVTVTTAYGPVTVKVHRMEGEVVTVSPEYEDCKKAALSSGAALDSVYQAAVAAWHDSPGNPQKGGK